MHHQGADVHFGGRSLPLRIPTTGDDPGDIDIEAIMGAASGLFRLVSRTLSDTRGAARETSRRLTRPVGVRWSAGNVTEPGHQVAPASRGVSGARKVTSAFSLNDVRPHMSRSPSASSRSRHPSLPAAGQRSANRPGSAPCNVPPGSPSQDRETGAGEWCRRAQRVFCSIRGWRAASSARRARAGLACGGPIPN